MGGCLPVTVTGARTCNDRYTLAVVDNFLTVARKLVAFPLENPFSELGSIFGERKYIPFSLIQTHRHFGERKRASEDTKRWQSKDGTSGVTGMERRGAGSRTSPTTLQC